MNNFAYPDHAQPALAAGGHRLRLSFRRVAVRALPARASGSARASTRIEGRIVDVEQRRRERLSSTMSCSRTGATVDGDLFVDCSGLRALLIGRRWASATRTGATGCPATARSRCRASSVAPLTPYTRVDRARCGLAMAHPAAAPHRQRPRLFERPSSRDDEAASMLLANLDGAPLADPRPVRFRPGKRHKRVGEERRRDRAGGRVPRAAGIDQHPPDPDRHPPADRPVPATGFRRRRHRRI